MTDPRTRASDADRDQTALLLRDSLVAGRLSVEEFQDRLNVALTARTLGELDKLRSDLPAVDFGALDGRARTDARPSSGRSVLQRKPGSVSAEDGRLSPGWRAAWGMWLALSLMAFSIWLISGATGGLWFLWVAIPLGALLLGGWITGIPSPGHSEPGRAGPAHGHGHHGRVAR